MKIETEITGIVCLFMKNILKIIFYGNENKCKFCRKTLFGGAHRYNFSVTNFYEPIKRVKNSLNISILI